MEKAASACLWPVLVVGCLGQIRTSEGNVTWCNVVTYIGCRAAEVALLRRDGMRIVAGLSRPCRMWIGVLSSSSPLRMVLITLALALAALAGNAGSMPVVFGVDFIFGSIAVMLAVELLGLSQHFW